MFELKFMYFKCLFKMYLNVSCQDLREIHNFQFSNM